MLRHLTRARPGHRACIALFAVALLCSCMVAREAAAEQSLGDKIKRIFEPTPPPKRKRASTTTKKKSSPTPSPSPKASATPQASPSPSATPRVAPSPSASPKAK
ncbi:MAG TPA: hypothetical protein VF551_01830, partial [Chthoniobacterales bacterium]